MQNQITKDINQDTLELISKNDIYVLEKIVGRGTFGVVYLA